jgi:hypothetical protein
MVLEILWPTFALVALVFVVWASLLVQRFRHMRRTPPSAANFADGEAVARYFRPVEWPAANLANLFEMPVLYFALVPLMVITSQATIVQVALAWAFVLLRAVHSFIHVVPRRVPPRFLAYLLSCAVLGAMWIGFFVDIAVAARAYHAAMAATAGGRL